MIELKYKIFDRPSDVTKFVNEKIVQRTDVVSITSVNGGQQILYYWEKQKSI